MQGHFSQADRALRRAASSRTVTSFGDKRQAPRKIARVPGFLRIPDHLELIPCRVLDISATGARIIFDFPAWTTPLRAVEVTLIMPFERCEVDCCAVWSIEREIGLNFRSVLRRR